jgi:hypothetical protein
MAAGRDIGVPGEDLLPVVRLADLQRAEPIQAAREGLAERLGDVLGDDRSRGVLRQSLIASVPPVDAPIAMMRTTRWVARRGGVLGKTASALRRGLIFQGGACAGFARLEPHLGRHLYLGDELLGELGHRVLQANVRLGHEVDRAERQGLEGDVGARRRVRGHHDHGHGA